MNGGYVSLDRGCVPKNIDSKRFGLWPMKAIQDVMMLALLGGTGFWGSGFEVVAAPNGAVSVTPGAGMVENDANAEQPAYRLTELETAQEFTPDPVVTPDNARIDLIVMRTVDVPVEEMRDFKNLESGQFFAKTQTVGYRFGAELGLLKGTEAVDPESPAVPSGWVALAEVMTIGSYSNVTPGITDRRRLLVDADALAAPDTATSGTRKVSALGPVMTNALAIDSESSGSITWYAHASELPGTGWWRLPVEQGRVLKSISVLLERPDTAAGNDVIIRLVQMRDGVETLLVQRTISATWNNTRVENINVNLPVDLSEGEYLLSVQLGAYALRYLGSGLVLV